MLRNEVKGRTTVSLTVRYASAAAREGALKTGMLDGMSATYDRLAEMLAAARSRRRETDGQSGWRSSGHTVWVSAAVRRRI